MNVRDRIATLADNFTAGIAADRICDQFIVIDRKELPAVSLSTDAEGELLIHEDNREYYAGARSAHYRKSALKDLAISDILAEYEAAEVESTRKQRRNELASELSNGLEWNRVSVVSQRAIDRIIELEAKS